VNYKRISFIRLISTLVIDDSTEYFFAIFQVLGGFLRTSGPLL
jgi:hypothetical protein